MKRNLGHILFLILGIASLGAAFFARTIGQGYAAHWGPGRWFLLIVGVLLVLGSLFTYWSPGTVVAARRRVSAFIQGLPIPSGIRSNSDLAFLADLCRRYIFTLPVAIVVLAIYLWVCTASLWLYRLPGFSGYYYDLQAQAFRNGSLSLLIEPSAQILALPNPYDPQQRQSLTAESSAPLDFSLYKGRYYEYWGPVPALLIDAVRPFYHGQFHDGVSDPELVFGFLSGLFLCEYLLILLVWQRFFSLLPKWILVISILLAGLISPSLEMLTRMISGTSLMVYQVAITAGQFFVVAGFLTAFSAVDRASPSGWRLVLAAAFWSLAIGSRVFLVIPVGFLFLGVAYWIYRSHGGALAGSLRGLIPLALPLACGAIALIWYNWARFGSMAETGLSFQLTGPYFLQKYLGETFLPVYFLQNLYNYVLLPFQVHPQFPYVSEARGSVSPLFSLYQLPEAYGANQISGLLVTAPFCIFAIAPLARLASPQFRQSPAGHPAADHDRRLFLWLILSLAAAALAPFVMLLFYFWAAARYIEDFMPALILLSLIGFWQGLSLLRPSSASGRLYLTLGTILAVASLGIGLLLPVRNNLQIWLANPLMLSWLSRFSLQR